MDGSSQKRSPRLIFVNRFFYPDESATSLILSDLCAHLSETGAEITVITSRLDYSNTSIRHAKREIWQGVRIRRVATTGFGRAGLIGRAVDYVSFYVTSFFCALSETRKGDILVAKTDPPLISLPISLVAYFRGAKLVNWLQDLFPEVATQLGVKPPLSRLLRWLRNKSLMAAQKNVVIGARMEQRLADLGVSDAHIETIHNFVDDETLSQPSEGAVELRAAWGFEPDDFIVGYSGNLGRAHDFETILRVAESSQAEARLKFLFIGGGHLRQQVESAAEARGLKNLYFKPYQPRSELAASLRVPDLHWISLRPELEGLIVPSKLYGVAAVARPVLMIGDPQGEVGRLVDEFSFGKAVAIGNADAAKAFIFEQLASPENRAQLAENAARFSRDHASRTLAFDLWSQMFNEVSLGKPQQM